MQQLKNWSLRKKILVFLVFSLLVAFYYSLPNKLFKNSYSTVLYDNKLNLLSARIADDGQWRFPYTDSVPDKFKTCIVQFEDKYFYYHPGVNVFSIAKAFVKNIKAGTVKSGGSTISMQVARLSRNNPKRTYVEKLFEIWLALRIECSLSKEKILHYYSCNAPFGGNVVGLHAASWRYYGRDPKNLSWAESALLAVLPNAPSLIYPGKNHHKLLAKRNRLLNRLYAEGIIDKTTFQLSLKEAIPNKPFPLPQLAPHLLQRACNEKGDGRIFRTTLVKPIQERIVQQLNDHVANLQTNLINNACAIVLDTRTGNVLAYVGNSYSKNKTNNNDVDIITAPRSSGSILKPILYAFMLNDGKIAPHSLVEDTPIQLGSYAPKNYNLSFDGLVPASEALSRSLNIPSVNMLRQYGTAAFLYQLRKVGFTTINRNAEHYGLSLILGGAEVTSWDVASVYSSLGRTLINFNERGSYLSNEFRKANYIYNSAEENAKYIHSEMLSAGCIWNTFNVMTELARPDDYSNNNTFSSLHKIAWKTGTSFGYRDAWAVGVNSSYTIVVWVGNADGEGRPGLTGINCAAPLMFSLFNTIGNNKWFSKPVKDITKLDVCKETGFRKSQYCEDFYRTETPATSIKSPLCSLHKIIHIDSIGRYQVNSLCYPVSKMKHQSYLVLTPLQEYFYKLKHITFMSVPPMMEGCIDESQHATFDIIYPRNNYKIYLPVNENNTKNKLVMNATNKLTNGKLYWYFDKEYIGETNHIHQMEVKPDNGFHELTVSDEKGKTIRVKFEIVDKK